MARQNSFTRQGELDLMAPTTPRPDRGAPLVLTIGHSTRPAAVLIDALCAHAVSLLLDVRAVPRSRRNPQFNREALAAALDKAGIAYRHLPALGGMRRPRPDSINTGWGEDAFRGYADYMQTPSFTKARDAVIEAARGQLVAIMCAEADPAHCHRSLIADALMAQCVAVEHIMISGERRAHALRAFARVSHGGVTYPPPLHR